MANTFKFGNGEWAVGKETALAYNDENSNFKPLPFTFDRSTGATVVNKQGLIETVGIDEPRIDFLNNTKGHLLLEPERRNYVTYSEDFSNWFAAYLYVTPNYALSPDGTQNASRCLFTGANQLISTPTSATGTLTGSMYVKGVAGETIQLAAGGGEDLITLNGEWQRLIVTKVNINGVFNINTFGGATARDLLIWGAQLEQGSYATSYIPTQGETNGVTRSAETNEQTLPNGVIGQAEGVIYAEVDVTALSEERRFVQLSDGDNNERMYIGILSTNRISGLGFNGGIGQWQITTNTDVTDGVNKVALSYATNSIKLFVNGEQIGVTDTNATIPACDEISISCNNIASNRILSEGLIEARLYNTALTDAELIALTS